MRSAPLSNGNVTFSVLSTEPVARPGHDAFNDYPDLIDFAAASRVRIDMQSHYYVTNARHGYYGLYELIVSGRCDCYGHAEECDVSVRPYTCGCLADSFTQGSKCDECQPLYNNKPFRRGDLTNAFPCKLCECNSHASSCRYDITLDPFPNDHDVGGGGVCIDCEHNTTGSMCDVCAEFYFRSVGKSLHAVDVCEPCNCSLAGVNNSALSCDKVRFANLKFIYNKCIVLMSSVVISLNLLTIFDKLPNKWACNLFPPVLHCV